MIQTIKNLLALRKIRNSCREFMTRDQSYIGILRQFIWYFKVYRPREKKGLMKYYLWPLRKKIIGYGLIEIKKGKKWISGGIIPSYRGKGQGELLFHSLRTQCGDTTYLEVLKTNILAIKLYKKLGFKTIKKRNYKLIMKYER